MSKVRLFVGIVATLFLAAYAATPVFAQFEAAKTLTGKISATKLVFIGGGGTIECGGFDGVWTLPASGAQTKEPFEVTKWKLCVEKASGFSNVSVEVSTCTFELKQPNKGTSGSAVFLDVFTCKFVAKIPLFGECKTAIQTKANENLATGKGKSVTAGWELLAEYAGITDTVSGSGCVGVSSTNAAILAGQILVEGQKLV